jgi:pyridoxal phosphate enzyme (YggS family)
MKEDCAIVTNLAAIEQCMAKAAIKSGRRPEDIGLIAVSKKQPVEKMLTYQSLLAPRKQEPVFGESYVQEFKKKRPALAPGFQIHLLGPLQSNKVRDALALFDVIESVHSQEMLTLIDKEAKRISKVQRVFLQVNISSDDDKHGFSKESVLSLLASDLASFSNIEICGLMTITRYYDDPEDVRPDFRAMNELGAICRALLEKSGRKITKWDISMGMSSDFEIAIEEGATLVRIGSALFGER